MSKKNASKKGNGLLGSIEELGNKLPHPVVIFVILALIIIVFNSVFSLNFTIFGSPNISTNWDLKSSK